MLPYLIAGAIGFGIGKLFENGGETFMTGGQVKEEWKSYLKESRVDALVKAGYSKNVAKNLSSESWDSLEKQVQNAFKNVLISEELQSMKGMMESLYTYGGLDKDNRYLEEYKISLGNKLFNKTFDEYRKELVEGYDVDYGTYTDSEGLTYSSLKKKYAVGGMTNEDILRSFLTSEKEIKNGNLQTLYGIYTHSMILYGSGSLLAKRIGRNVKIYGRYGGIGDNPNTPSGVIKQLKALAEEMGYSVQYVDRYAGGGSVDESSFKKYANKYDFYTDEEDNVIRITSNDKELLDKIEKDYSDRIAHREYDEYIEVFKNKYAGGGKIKVGEGENKGYLLGYEPYFEKYVWIASIDEDNKIVRPTHGYFPKHPLSKEAINWAKKNGYDYMADGKKYDNGGEAGLTKSEISIIDDRINYYYDNEEYTDDAEILASFVIEGGEIDSSKYKQIIKYIESQKFTEGGGVDIEEGDNVIMYFKADTELEIYEYEDYEMEEPKYEIFKKGENFEVDIFGVDSIKYDVQFGDGSIAFIRKNEVEIVKVNDSNYAGGGVAKKRRRSASAQYGRSDRSFDKQLTAKPVGYRFSNAKANQLRKDPYAKPTEAQVKKYLGKGIYKENRRNRSDRDRNAKL